MIPRPIHVCVHLYRHISGHNMSINTMSYSRFCAPIPSYFRSRYVNWYHVLFSTFVCTCTVLFPVMICQLIPCPIHICVHLYRLISGHVSLLFQRPVKFGMGKHSSYVTIQADLIWKRIWSLPLPRLTDLLVSLSTQRKLTNAHIPLST